MTFYHSPSVLIHLSKIVYQRESIDTSLKLFVCYYLVPLYLFDHLADAIFTACYLINRMSSSSLANKVPYSTLFSHEPLFHIFARVFDCVLSASRIFKFP